MVGKYWTQLDAASQGSYRDARKQIGRKLSFKSFVRRLVDDILGAGKGMDVSVDAVTLPQRFKRNVLSSFSSSETWILRKSGVHSLPVQPHAPGRRFRDGNYSSFLGSEKDAWFVQAHSRQIQELVRKGERQCIPVSNVRFLFVIHMDGLPKNVGNTFTPRTTSRQDVSCLSHHARASTTHGKIALVPWLVKM